MTRCDLVFQTTGGSVPSISASLQKKRDKRGFSGSGSPRDLELVTYRNELNDQFSLLPIPLMVKVSLSLSVSRYIILNVHRDVMYYLHKDRNRNSKGDNSLTAPNYNR